MTTGTAQPWRVLYSLPNVITAGSGRALYEIARRLDRTRFSPSLCLERRGGALDTLFEEAGIPVIEAPFTVSPRPLKALPGAVARAARPLGGFDLWHSFHYLDDYTEPLVARRAGARWVFTKKSMSWNRRSWFLRALLARRIAAQNRDMIARFFPSWPLAGKTEWIPRGVDLERFSPAVLSDDPAELAAARTEAKVAFGIDPAMRHVGCVAHLVPVKGHEVLLRAFARLRCSEDTHLLIAGRGEPERAAALDALARELGIADRVSFLGGVSDVPGLLRALDVFVLPTLGSGRMEGCPVALLEAMASHTPAIATDIPGSRDLLDDSTGHRVPPGDTEALAAALESALGDPATSARRAAAAHRRVLEHHDIALEVARHEAFYERALAGRSRRASTES